MERQITNRLKSVYTCYEMCSETIVYLDEKPVMKIYTSFFEHNYGRKSYRKYHELDGWREEITRDEFYQELERLKSA